MAVASPIECRWTKTAERISFMRHSNHMRSKQGVASAACVSNCDSSGPIIGRVIRQVNKFRGLSAQLLNDSGSHIPSKHICCILNLFLAN